MLLQIIPSVLFNRFVGWEGWCLCYASPQFSRLKTLNKRQPCFYRLRRLPINTSILLFKKNICNKGWNRYDGRLLEVASITFYGVVLSTLPGSDKAFNLFTSCTVMSMDSKITSSSNRNDVAVGHVSERATNLFVRRARDPSRCFILWIGLILPVLVATNMMLESWSDDNLQIWPF